MPLALPTLLTPPLPLLAPSTSPSPLALTFAK